MKPKEAKYLTKKIIDKYIIVRKYNDIKSVKKSDTCSICLEEFRSDEKVRQIITCRHIFHQQCIIDWVNHKEKCPNCNQELTKETLEGKKFDPNESRMMNEEIRNMIASPVQHEIFHNVMHDDLLDIEDHVINPVMMNEEEKNSNSGGEINERDEVAEKQEDKWNREEDCHIVSTESIDKIPEHEALQKDQKEIEVGFKN